MKITTDHVARVLGARLEQMNGVRRSETTPAAAATRADRALFSPRSEDVRAGMEAARAAGQPDEERLAALAAEVRAERYRVSSDVVAEALLRDFGR